MIERDEFLKIKEEERKPRVFFTSNRFLKTNW